MPYIKISDPNIIDLAAWHQVINVVNQHSDSITAITNNFGAEGTGYTDWNGSLDVAQQYDPGSQKIIFGRSRIDTRAGGDSYTPANKHMYYATINMVDNSTGTTAFSAKPIITVTAQFGSTNTVPPTTNANIACTVINVLEDKFTVRLVDTRSYSEGTTSKPVVPLTSYFNLSWMAIGPK